MVGESFDGEVGKENQVMECRGPQNEGLSGVGVGELVGVEPGRSEVSPIQRLSNQLR